MGNGIVRVAQRSQIEAWVRLGARVLGIGHDSAGLFTILAFIEEA